MERRHVLKALAGTPALACRTEPAPEPSVGRSQFPQQQALHNQAPPRSAPLVKRVHPLSSPFPTLDPFLFCAYHRDDFPPGNAEHGPAVSLDGRRIGSDFSGQDGFSMYHGEVVPGFPGHPHRGFETVTLARRGLVDHADSLGAAGRYGHGDVQWLTAGGGIVHAEMFPLLERAEANPLDLFQIWLNLPSRDKFVRPYFSMFWREQIPQLERRDDADHLTQINVIAGDLFGALPPQPPPNSWAARPESDLLLATLEMQPHARLTLPEARAGSNRMIYFVRGSTMEIAGTELNAMQAAELDAKRAVLLQNGSAPADLLVLQGRPIGEPVVKRGPFVMNSAAEIREAYIDYQATGFGGWPWKSRAPVHGNQRRRFARYADGRIESAPGGSDSDASEEAGSLSAPRAPAGSRAG